MNIGLIDVDLQSRGKCTFPNLPLMKISAYHKRNGDNVQWYSPMLSGHMDKVYMSKVFSDEYTHDYMWSIDADQVIKGGSGYAISVKGGKQVYDKTKDKPLPDQIEHIMPDYSIYEQFGIHDTAFGSLTKGCPRGCDFCHVKDMIGQGRCVKTVARLDQFWDGQKNIVLLDPNITASKDFFMHMDDLAESKSMVDFSQGLDIRMMTRQKSQALNSVKWKRIHFAWDRPQDDPRQKFTEVRQHLKGCRRDKVSCYILTNFNSTIQQDIARVQFIKSLDIQPYVMIYRKHTAPQSVRKLARYANNPYVCWKTKCFQEYDSSIRSKNMRSAIDESDGD